MVRKVEGCEIFFPPPKYTSDGLSHLLSCINMSVVKVLTVMIAVILFSPSSQKICISFMFWDSFGYKQTAVPRLFSCVLQN